MPWTGQLLGAMVAYDALVNGIGVGNRPGCRHHGILPRTALMDEF